ncbi:MAG: hypothetical protein JRJ29_03110 [Deltaproteobacteria bacterium]|nr:hypothetical protein [Deltaproteobacteria bacterium]
MRIADRDITVQICGMSGNLAIGKAALDAGVKLYFAYPITPATPIMEYLSGRLPRQGGKVIQMEEEISSIGAVPGSFYAGRRAMKITSLYPYHKDIIRDFMERCREVLHETFSTGIIYWRKQEK